MCLATHVFFVSKPTCPFPSCLHPTVSDVIEYSELDLDMADMGTNVDLLTEPDMTAAFTAYSYSDVPDVSCNTRVFCG